MPLPLTLTLLGLLYVIVFGGLSFFRREGLSARFALESVVLAGVMIGLSTLADFPLHPVVFLAVLYAVTMRVRLLVDLGNFLARRGNHCAAERVYQLALRLWPDDASRLIVQVNQGVLKIKQEQLDEAIGLLRQVLAQAEGGHLGLKYECAAHYDLGVAYQRQGHDAQAVLEFNAVLETWPASEYARYATIALERRRKSSHQ